MSLDRREIVEWQEAVTRHPGKEIHSSLKKKNFCNCIETGERRFLPCRKAEVSVPNGL